ncbi:uncharacterized protein LOC113508071 [Trichoplusia ni]|uniref:Uncharacterized protein LOC113508071 n=1 Tax=Trichoplusia ni TaxID=7111 RepID=A0A7E5X314_TRINI|nr:uncharacterized protein LOC113508071 [Trichoplusia ni]
MGEQRVVGQGGATDRGAGVGVGRTGLRDLERALGTGEALRSEGARRGGGEAQELRVGLALGAGGAGCAGSAVDAEGAGSAEGARGAEGAGSAEGCESAAGNSPGNRAPYLRTSAGSSRASATKDWSTSTLGWDEIGADILTTYLADSSTRTFREKNPQETPGNRVLAGSTRRPPKAD